MRFRRQHPRRAASARQICRGGTRRRVAHLVLAVAVAAAVSAPTPVAAAPANANDAEVSTAQDTGPAAIVERLSEPGPTSAASPPPRSAATVAQLGPTPPEPPQPTLPTTAPPPPPTTPPPAPPPPPPPPTYLVGDSITDMNRAIIAPVFDDCGAEVHLHSLSARRIEQGYEWNGRWVNSGLDEIDQILGTTDPATWIIELGSNDLQDLGTEEEAHRLIRTVLDRIDDNDRVLWTTVLWPHYSTATEIFNAALRITPGIELVDWYAVGGNHLVDPVHPTDEGARLLASMYCTALQG